MNGESCFHNLKTGGLPRQLAPGISARIFPGVHAMLSVVTLAPHSTSPVHAHPNEQWGVCLEGSWIRIQDGVEHEVKAGDFWQTPPGGQSLTPCGSSQSRRALPMRLMVRVVTKMARPGKVAIHQEFSM